VDIDSLTVGQLKEIQSLVGNGQKYFPYSVGDKVFIRSVTLYYTGRISHLKDDWITLENASWIADTGRFYDFLKYGKCSEYESFQKTVSIPVQSLIDITAWDHALFEGNK